MTRIQVTAEDIANGTRGNCAFCPVARAVCRATGSVDVSVTGLGVTIWCGEETASLAIPDAVGRFVDDFDCGKPVHPIEFDLDIPPQFLRQPEAR